MLPKKYRLPLRTELKRVQKKGQLFQGQFFSLLLAPSQKDQTLRFASIVSNKINKSAVRRNQIRRLLTEAVQIYLPKLKLGFDGVFLVKKSILDRNFSEIKKEVEKLFQQANLIEQDK